MKTRIKSPTEIEAMRVSGRYLAEILHILQDQIKPGMTTKDLDDIAAIELKKRSAQPAFLGYNGFPANICISVNDEIVHGIPSTRVIQSGDIVCMDFGVLYDGMITDSAVTVPVGEVSPQTNHLLKTTKTALYNAIDILRDGVRVGDIGAEIGKTITEGGLKVIYDLGGHGVGHKVHEDPMILNFGTKGNGAVLRAGMTIALEPIASIGTHNMYLKDDGWTYTTDDKSLSAQFEHTILITRDGSEILTKM